MDPKHGRSPSEDKEYWHNKGQEDASNGDYNSPSHGWLNTDDDAKNSDAYDSGWRNTKDQ